MATSTVGAWPTYINNQSGQLGDERFPRDTDKDIIYSFQRLSGLFSQIKVYKVALGDRFSVVLTDTGQLFSFGLGNVSV